jgi:hypothetical protein
MWRSVATAIPPTVSSPVSVAFGIAAVAARVAAPAMFWPLAVDHRRRRDRGTGLGLWRGVFLGLNRFFVGARAHR